MAEAIPHATLTGRADSAARAAADRAGVSVVELHEPADMERITDLILRVWRSGADTASVSPDLLRALAVETEVQSRGVGYALKLHQRAWALHEDVRTITWTSDPLIRRNAWFNLNKLGASVVEYLPEFYGAMRDGINAGDLTDRCLVRWDLLGEGAMAALDSGFAATSMTRDGCYVLTRA